MLWSLQGPIDPFPVLRLFQIKPLTVWILSNVHEPSRHSTTSHDEDESAILASFAYAMFELHSSGKTVQTE